VDWIYLAQDGDRWRVLVNTTMKLSVSCEAANLLTTSPYCYMAVPRSCLFVFIFCLESLFA
jgi:hypothetical protein